MKTIERQIIEKYEDLVERLKTGGLTYNPETIERLESELSALKSQLKDEEQPIIVTDEMIQDEAKEYAKLRVKELTDSGMMEPSEEEIADIELDFMRAAKWALSLKAQKPSDEDIEIWAKQKYPGIGLKNLPISIAIEAAKAMRDNKIPVSGKDEKK